MIFYLSFETTQATYLRQLSQELFLRIAALSFDYVLIQYHSDASLSVLGTILKNMPHSGSDQSARVSEQLVSWETNESVSLSSADILFFRYLPKRNSLFLLIYSSYHFRMEYDALLSYQH